MWFYIGIFVATAFIWRTRDTWSVWAKQILANQIGNRLVEMHHKYYIVWYPYGVSWYKILIPRRRRPVLIDTITDENGNDVKKDVLAFMGPSHNFHGIATSPNTLGYESLTFTDLDSQSKTFVENETMSF